MGRGLTDDTPIPLKWAAGIVLALGGFISTALFVGMWVSTVESNQRSMEDKLSVYKERNGLLDIYMRSIDSRLSNIEGRLGLPSKKAE